MTVRCSDHLASLFVAIKVFIRIGRRIMIFSKPENHFAHPIFRTLLLLLSTLFIFACSTPVGTYRVDPRILHQELTSNVLSTETPSGPSQIVLNRHDLRKLFASDPESTLSCLHKIVVSGVGGSDEIFALAELSFLHAEKTRKRSYHLAASIYAYAFLFDNEKAGEPASSFDTRFRLACDLYNRGLTSGFCSENKSRVDLRAGIFDLPFGKLEVSLDAGSLQWNGRELVDFKPVAELDVKGLRNRYRQSGIGAPLAAAMSEAGANSRDLVAREIQVPVTLVLHLDDIKGDLGSDVVRGTLRLYPTDEISSVPIGSQKAPLEAERTASLASMLADSNVWEMEIKAFLKGDYVLKLLGALKKDIQLNSLRPSRTGLIPVVFVHGTASSPGRWADITNELYNDPAIRERYQFWYFFYDTGNPVAYSAMLLREALSKTIASLDPKGEDSALNNMVVIGHSQGGLLTKMTAIDSGARFWDNFSSKPFKEVNLPDKTRDVLRRSLFVKPLPFVKRLVFMATPHQGSYIAGWGITKWLTGLVMTPAQTVLALTNDVLKIDKEALAADALRGAPTSIDNMRPGHQFIKTLYSLPISAGVPYHSIIAVKQSGPVENGSDGVVKYKSAHLEGAQSELVVQSGHSCQSDPHAIEEIRRILLLHAGGISSSDGKEVEQSNELPTGPLGRAWRSGPSLLPEIRGRQ